MNLKETVLVELGKPDVVVVSINGDGFEKKFDATLPRNWGIHVVPHRQAYIVERFGKYVKTLTRGVHVSIPFIDRVAHVHSLKLEAIPFRSKQAVTKDNTDVYVDCRLYVKVVDPKLASYAVEGAIPSLIQLVRAMVHDELGKITLRQLFRGKHTISKNIVIDLNEAVKNWGLHCPTFEIEEVNIAKADKTDLYKQEYYEELKRRLRILETEGEVHTVALLAKYKEEGIQMVANTFKRLMEVALKMAKGDNAKEGVLAGGSIMKK
ncbi:OLC1v1037235C1 [Oldenlandia corymbosa var. corymbosa]|uniref:OLC1v1037235C1 n=1 Tax=Oldenlandia corymbosa var. corymbosa TaxID=529605 RepID=A0AAV1CX42_OLDCO|nr:OLC1v1037235C1 [Oldenlandia corymbosa var. corymbosa]